VNEWLWAAAVLTVALAALVVVAVRRPLLEGLVALEAAGATGVLVLLLIAEGTRRQPFGDLALVLGVVSFAGAIAFLRFGREVEE
jgi:multisubunit Na+/H+ antiporter MnhF subunit